MNRGGCLVVAAALGALLLAGCTVQPLPAGPGDGDVAEYYSAMSDARWDSMGFGPSVERPVIVGAQPIPREVWATRVAACMVSAGFTNYSEQGGGLSVAAPDTGASGLGEQTDIGQQTEERLALYNCQELYPIAADAAGVLSHAQLLYIYRYYVRFLVPCLESRGYDLGEVPPGEAFLERGTNGFWNPYLGGIARYAGDSAAGDSATDDSATGDSATDERDSDVLDALQAQCPPMPPGMGDAYGG